jgi:hypothetical protein
MALSTDVMSFDALFAKIHRHAAAMRVSGGTADATK